MTANSLPSVVDKVWEYCLKLELLQKVTIHLQCHLVDNMLDFGSSSAFNSERSDKAKLIVNTYV